MSANFYWAPQSQQTSISVGSKTKFAFSMTEIFGNFPIDLDEKDTLVLRGMSLADGEQNNPYTQLIDAIDKHGSIRVTRES